MWLRSKKSSMPDAADALPGRDAPAFRLAERHFVSGRPLLPPYPKGLEQAMFGLGCFWGAERAFWQQPGVWVTAVGYAGGRTPNPTYEEVCSGRTGHNEVVRVVFDPSQVSYEQILKLFWESHDPTQGMRQGNDVGTQYRSAIYTTTPEQAEVAAATKTAFEARLKGAGYGAITTEIAPLDTFYYESDDIHQQYLAKVPNGYCGLGGTGVSCPTGLSLSSKPTSDPRTRTSSQ